MSSMRASRILLAVVVILMSSAVGIGIGTAVNTALARSGAPLKTEVEQEATELAFNSCYFCSTNGLCLTVTSGTGRIRCTPRSGGRPCSTSGNPCAVTLYNQAFMDAKIVNDTAAKYGHVELQGTIKNEKEEPVSEFKIKCYLPNQIVISTISDSKGKFKLEISDISNEGKDAKKIDLGDLHIDSTAIEKFIPIFGSFQKIEERKE